MSALAAPSLPLHRLDARTYGQMVQSGALAGEPVELIEGLLVEMSPQSPDHAAIVEELTRHLSRARARLRVQLPLEVSSDSVPEPDLALVAEKPPPDRHPRTALLVVEVAVSSQQIDREVKARLYAGVGVPLYWLVDVPGKVVEVRGEPGPDGYRRCEVYGVGVAVPAPAEGVAELDVGSLLEGICG
jgi:Uma2 family endonuclease